MASALGSIASTFNPIVNGTSLSAISITFQNILVNANGAATPTVSFNGAGLTLSGAGVSSISSAAESTNTVTITTTTAHGFQVGQYVTITGVGAAGYNGTFYINSVPTATTFTYLDLAITSAAASGGGSAAVVSSIFQSLGTGTLNLQGTDYYTGTTTVNQGTLTVSGAGVLLATTAITVNPGATFTLDNTGTNVFNRINSVSTVTLAGGTLNYLGAANTASTQSFGTLTFSAGNSTVQTTAGTGGSVAVTFASLTRSAGGVLNFQAGGSGQALGSATNQVIFNATPASLETNGVIMGATVTDATSITGVNTTGFNLAANVSGNTTTTSIAAFGGTISGTSYSTFQQSGTAPRRTTSTAATPPRCRQANRSTRFCSSGLPRGLRLAVTSP